MHWWSASSCVGHSILSHFSALVHLTPKGFILIVHPVRTSSDRSEGEEDGANKQSTWALGVKQLRGFARTAAALYAEFLHAIFSPCAKRKGIFMNFTYLAGKSSENR
jgi:hypothetical protein